jgi:2-polyprenyl-3-methyl-5-hydroxy-6-metoxy-1,4-benzoquinol methylase
VRSIAASRIRARAHDERGGSEDTARAGSRPMRAASDRPGSGCLICERRGGVEFTGERYMPQLDEAEISFEHWHRYLWVEPFIAGKAVLDIACGEGYGAALLARSAAHVTGVDSDADTLDRARATYARPNLDFLCGSAQEIPLVGTHLFDVVVSFETIEHLGEEDQRQFLDEIKRLLKPDGIAVFSTPNRTVYSDKPHYHNPFHIKEFSRKEFEALLGHTFEQVGMFGQRLYAGSYLWPLQEKSAALREYQLDHAKGRYTPTAKDKKEALYFLAVCANCPIDQTSASFLLDAADQLIGGRRENGERLQEQVTLLQAQLQEKQATLSGDQQEQGLLLEKQAEALRTTLAHQDAHIALLTERYSFLTTREAESRRQTLSAHEQLALRDADYRNLLANYESQRRELLQAYEQLLHAQEQITHLSLQEATAHAEKADVSRYAEELERSWHEKNAHIAVLERQVHTPSLSMSVQSALSRVIRRLSRRGRQ